MVEGIPETADGVRGRSLQVMLNQRKIKARRKKRKELFGIQMCFVGVLLGFATGLSSLAQKAGEEQFMFYQHAFKCLFCAVGKEVRIVDLACSLACF